MTTKPLIILAGAMLLAGHVYGAAIQGVAINAVSSEYSSAADTRRAVNMVNGVGLFGDLQSPNAPGAMWLTLPASPASSVAAAFVTFDLGSVHMINRMRVWNYNEAQSGTNVLTRRGIRTADISVAGEDQIYTTNIFGQTLNRASGVLSNLSDVITMGVSARYVRFNVKTNFGEGDFRVGLSKVLFIDDTVPPTVKLATRSYSGTQVTVQFSESVSVATATNPANYSITTGATNVSVLGAAMGVYNDTVVLQTAAMNSNLVYTLNAQNVMDAANVISITNTQINIDPEFVLWLKADSGITTDGSGNVTQWNDQSGLGNNAIATSPPALVSGALNGQPVVHFNGTSLMEVAPNSSLAANRDLTLYTVVSADTTATPAQDIISKCLANIPATFDLQLTVTAGKPSIVRGNGSGFTSFSGSQAALTPGQYYILSAVTKGTNATHYLNGNFNGSGAIVAGLNDNNTPIRLGIRADNALNLRGSLAEVMVIRGALSDADRAVVDSYLGAKYGISVVPLAITGQPQNANRVVGQTATFGVSAVAGTPTLFYQWQKNSVNIGGATNATYTTPTLALTDNFTTYGVTVSTPLGVTTNSTTATLVVTADNQPPRVFSATKKAGSSNDIVVAFSEPVSLAAATNPANYALSNGANVTGASMGATSNIVALTTTSLNPGTLYGLSVQNVQDAFGNTMAAVSVPVLPATAVLMVRADSGIIADGSNLVGEWDDQTTNKNNAMQYTSVPKRPTLVAGAMNGKPVLRFDGVTNFLEVVSSPTLAITGDMSIYVAANFADYATGREILGKTQGNQPAPYDYYVLSATSSAHFYRGNGAVNADNIATTVPSVGATHTLGVTMQGTNVSQFLDGAANGAGGLATAIADAGTPLRIGSRGDLLQYMKGDLAEIMIFNSALSANDRKIVESYLGVKYFPIVFTQQPAGTNITEGTTATFSVGVTAGGATFGYQWQKNLVDIPGATNATYTTPELSQADNNSSYMAVVSIPGGGTTNSASAVVTVQADTVAPTVASVGKKFWNQTQLVVVFSETVDVTTATTLGNYALDNGGVITGAAIGGASNQVVLTTTGLNPATSYSLTVNNVKDRYNNTMSPSTTPSGFYPPTLALWLKADAGVTADGSSLVSEWDDQSGNGNNAFQGGGALFEPTLVANGLNGRPVLRFDPANTGATNYLIVSSSPSLAITGDISIYTVAKFTDFLQPREIIGKTTLNQPASFDYYVSSVPTVRLYRGNGAVSATVTATAPSTNAPHLVGVTMAGTSVTHFLDGKTNSTGTLTIATADNGDSVGIGTRSDLAQIMKGDIAEIVVMSSALSSADRVELENYLAGKYSLLLGPAPTLRFSPVSGNSFTLSWLTPSISFALESSGSLVAPSWATVTNSVASSNGTNSVIINGLPANQFYRLHHAP